MDELDLDENVDEGKIEEIGSPRGYIEKNHPPSREDPLWDRVPQEDSLWDGIPREDSLWDRVPPGPAGFTLGPSPPEEDSLWERILPRRIRLGSESSRGGSALGPSPPEEDSLWDRVLPRRIHSGTESPTGWGVAPVCLYRRIFLAPVLCNFFDIFSSIGEF